ncbi:MAG TPA: LuxR C-terminal-related transcriptional regulator, partial [Lapillicoccus sp.]|nr:LuxR C-terminal-related transcriptional regulator [Lapillicoccus sp.]
SAEVPYAALTSAVRRWLRGRPDDRAAAAGRELLQLMVGTAAQSDQVTIGRVLQAADDVVDELTRVGPTLWVIDDLHWSDTSSRDVLAYLLAGLHAQRLGLVLLVRAEHRTEGHPLNEWLADLRRDPTVRDVTVGRLTAEQTEEQVAALAGVPPSYDLVTSIHERTDGNPYFTELFVRGLPSGTAQPPVRTPHGLLDAVAARWHSLPGPSRDLARVLAVGGRPRLVDLLERVCVGAGLRLGSLDHAVRDGVRGGVLTFADEVVWFRHPLLPDVLAKESGLVGAPAIHAAYAAVLKEVDAGDILTAADIALHEEQAGQDAEAYAWSLETADRAALVSARAECWTALDRACRLWSCRAATDGDDRSQHVELLRRTAEAARLAGEVTAAVERLEEAIALVDEDRDPLLASELLVTWITRRWDATPGVAYILPELHRAIDLASRAPDSVQYALAVTELAIGQVWDYDAQPEDRLGPDGPVVPGRHLAHQALELAERTGHPRAIARALCAVAIAEYHMPETDPIGRLQRAWHLAEEAGDTLTMAFAAVYWQNYLVHEGLYEEQIPLALRLAEALAKAGDPITSRFMTADAAFALLHLGEWTRAEALLRAALTSNLRGLATGGACDTAALLAVRRGRVGAALRYLDRLAQVIDLGFMGGPIARSRVEYHLLVGDPSAALHHLRARHDAGGWRDGSGDMHLALAAAAAADLAQQARDRRDPEGVRHAYRELAALTDLFRSHEGDPATALNEPRRNRGWTALVPAETARCHATDDEADAWRHARDVHREIRFPWEEAYCGWRLARALVRLNAPRKEVREALRAAYPIAERLGAEPLKEQIESDARAAHLRLDAVEDVVLDLPDQGLLSEREREVLEHVIAGRTNAEIAAALFISEKTAGAHVSNILRKTQTRNRVEAAAWGQRLAAAGMSDRPNRE